MADMGKIAGEIFVVVIITIIIEALILSVNFSSAILNVLMPFVPVLFGLGAIYIVARQLSK